MKGRKKGSTKIVNTIKDLVPLFFSLAIASKGISIATQSLGKVFGEEIKQRMLEFKKMGVVELKVINKETEIEYHYLDGIENYLKNFCKRNKKYKWEKEEYMGIKTGRYILTRVYRRYYKKTKEEEICSECGRSYDD
jgi:hypothetical protein